VVTTHVIAGVFVGGAGKRMGERAKGLLEAPGGGTLVDRWLSVLHEVGVARVLLVGSHPAYRTLGLETIDDEPSGVGPIGGLAALLRGAGASRALALACDMPFVSAGLVQRLIAAPEAPVVAPWRNGRWEPLCARYDAARVLPIALRRIEARQYALHLLLAEAGAAPLPLEPGDKPELRDWDTPEDMQHSALAPRDTSGGRPEPR
jgi:molybdopterin-guanine dinucleotide biosynthesis protein A